MKCKICENCGCSLDFDEVCDCKPKMTEWDKVNTFFKSTNLNPNIIVGGSCGTRNNMDDIRHRRTAFTEENKAEIDERRS